MGFNRRTFLLSTLGLAGLGYAASNLVFKLPVFGKAPLGDRLTRIQQSPNWKNGAFQNLEPVEVMTRPVSESTSHSANTSWIKDFFFGDKSGREPEQAIPVVKNHLKAMADESLLWLGHSAFLFRISGLTVLADPAFHAASPVPELPMIQPFKGTDAYSADDFDAIDVLLITHDHYDHLDYETVKKLAPKTRHVVCPLGVGAILEGWGYDAGQITELDWFEAAQFGELTVTATPSQHFSGRTLTRNQTLWCGFVLSTERHTIYLSGDGGYGRHFEKIRTLFPRIDFAILENGQYNVEWSKIHLMPQDLTQAVKDLAPRYFLTSHHARFCLSNHGWTEPMENALQTELVSGVPLIGPRIGERVDLTNPDTTKSFWWRSLARKD